MYDFAAMCKMVVADMEGIGTKFSFAAENINDLMILIIHQRFLNKRPHESSNHWECCASAKTLNMS